MTFLAVLAALLVAVIVAALARFDHDQRRIAELEVENRRMRRQIERCERSVGGRIRAAHREHTRHWEVA